MQDPSESVEAQTFFRKPRRLKEGDVVAVLSPSWGGPSVFPHVFDMGLRNLERHFGLKIKEYPTARMAAELTYENPKLRAEDLNQAFADPEVSGIIASIGGDDSARILPYLDLDKILANPKIFMGFSDTAALLTYLNGRGLVTYNGPSVMAGFAQLEHLPPAFADHLHAILFAPTDTYEYRPYDQWADEFVEWGIPGYDGRRRLIDSSGWRWLQGSGVGTGRLFGGCIEVLEFLKGTRFWPPDGFFRDKILFFETSEDKPSVNGVKYMLRNYGYMGVFDQVSAILFGRALSYSEEEKTALEKMLVQVVAEEFGRPHLPLVANMDFGHTDPQLILPLGVHCAVDCANFQVKLLESSVL